MIENLYIQDDLYGNFLNYNVKVKTFSNGNKSIQKTSFDNFIGKCRNNRHNGSLSSEQLEYFKKRNLSKMKSLIYDLAYENGCIVPWIDFVTITFDDNKVNAFNYDEAKNKLKQWLDRMRRKSRDMRYIIIAELHKSGRIHFHGLFSNVNWELIPARNPHNNRLIYKNGCQIFNIKDFNYGFTTVSKIKDINAVTYYITKYITKDLLDIKNKKHYWASRNLSLPKQSYYKCFDDDSFYKYLDNCGDLIEQVSNKTTCQSVTEYFNTTRT